MSRPARLLIGLVLLAGVCSSLALPEEPAGGNRPSYKSPLGLVVDEKGHKAYVALHTADAVAEVDLRAGKVVRTLPVGRGPWNIVLKEQVISLTCEGSDELITVDAPRWVVQERTPLQGDPLPLPLLVDGSCISAPPGLDRLALRQQYPEWSNARGQVTRKNGTCFLAHQIHRAGVPASQIAQGWVFSNHITVSIEGGSVSIPLDEPQRGFADPSAVVCRETVPGTLFVSCAGADMVLALDLNKLTTFLNRESGKGISQYQTAHNLTASRHYVIATIPTQANPRHLALSGDAKTLVVSNYLSDSLTVIDTDKLQVVRHIPLGDTKPNSVRRGEILFNSNRLTFQGQFTCASCHPNGDQDGLNWDLERDGIGNFKNTKSLLGIKDTAPHGWHGNAPDLADRVRGTLRTLHRHEPSEAEVADLVAYLESLPPRPVQINDEDRAAIARGKDTFTKARCATCHPGPTFQDGKTHDIGTAGPTDTQDRFDTPSLRGLTRSAPYLHDGRAMTLGDVLTKFNPTNQHGAADRLSTEELEDLIMYLKSL